MTCFFKNIFLSKFMSIVQKISYHNAYSKKARPTETSNSKKQLTPTAMLSALLWTTFQTEMVWSLLAVSFNSLEYFSVLGSICWVSVCWARSLMTSLRHTSSAPHLPIIIWIFALEIPRMCIAYNSLNVA